MGRTVQGSNPGGGRDFLHLSRPALEPTQPPVQWVPSLSQGVKQRGRGVDHPPPFSAEVKERVQLYLYSPYGPLWPVLGCTLPLPVRRYTVLSANWTAGFWFLAGADIFLSQYSDWVSVLSRNRLARAWNSPPTVAKVKNGCNFTPLPHMSTQYPS